MRKAHFQKLVPTYKYQIFSFALYYMGNRPDAEDITQEVLIRFWKHFDSINKKSTKAWLMRVTHNLCIDYARRRKKSADLRNEDTVLVSHENPAADAEQADLKKRIFSALQSLPERLRAIIMMRELEGMKYE